MPNITKNYIDDLKFDPKNSVKYDSALKGFGIRVYPPDSEGKNRKSFVLRYTNIARDRRMMVLGAYGSMTVTKAREIAQKHIVAIHDGADPLAEKRAKRAAVLSDNATFQQVVDKFIERYAKPRQRTWEQTKRILEVNCACWLDRSITSITQAEAQDLVDGFLAEGYPAKARVTFLWLRTLFGWAWRRDILAKNIMSKMEIHIEPKSRDRVYSDDEIKAVWQAANDMGGIEGGYIKLVLLLGVRKSELAGMKRGEFDDPDNPSIWVIPHERVKVRKSVTTKRVYTVPLPPLAQRIIKSLPRLDNELIFPSARNGKTLVPGNALANKLTRMSGVEGWTYHACRHTVATWLENKGHSEYERGLVLNHSAFGVTGDYSHGHSTELKHDLLEKWADHVASVVQPKGVAVLS